MKLIEFFFQIEKTVDSETSILKAYDFWSYDGMDTYYFFKAYEKYSDVGIEGYVEQICDFEFFLGDELYVDWEKLQPLFGIEIADNPEIPDFEPAMRNQYLVIRGSCLGNCSKQIIPSYGYAARVLPSCEPVVELTHKGDSLHGDTELVIKGLKPPDKVKVGATVLTLKYADYLDMIFNAAYWMGYCHNLDVVMLNFDFSPTEREPELNFNYAYFAVQVKGNQMQLVTNPQKIKRLYRDYSTLPFVDYY